MRAGTRPCASYSSNRSAKNASQPRASSSFEYNARPPEREMTKAAEGALEPLRREEPGASRRRSRRVQSSVRPPFVARRDGETLSSPAAVWPTGTGMDLVRVRLLLVALLALAAGIGIGSHRGHGGTGAAAPADQLA